MPRSCPNRQLLETMGNLPQLWRMLGQGNPHPPHSNQGGPIHPQRRDGCSPGWGEAYDFRGILTPGEVVVPSL
jgi:hypothetical protein